MPKWSTNKIVYELWSSVLCGNDLISRGCAQGPPGVGLNRGCQQAHAAVGHTDLHACRMPRGSAAGVTQAFHVNLVLRRPCLEQGTGTVIERSKRRAEGRVGVR